MATGLTLAVTLNVLEQTLTKELVQVNVAEAEDVEVLEFQTVILLPLVDTPIPVADEGDQDPSATCELLLQESKTYPLYVTPEELEFCDCVSVTLASAII